MYIEQVFLSKHFETKHRISAYGRDVETFIVLNWFSFFLGLVHFIQHKRPEYLRSIILAGKKIGEKILYIIKHFSF